MLSGIISTTKADARIGLESAADELVSGEHNRTTRVQLHGQTQAHAAGQQSSSVVDAVIAKPTLERSSPGRAIARLGTSEAIRIATWTRGLALIENTIARK